MQSIEAELRSLLKGEFSSLILSFNDSPAMNYATVEQYETNYGDSVSTWVSEEERAKGYAENSMWTLHWYPNTPNGFYDIAASSLPALFEGLRKLEFK